MHLLNFFALLVALYASLTLGSPAPKPSLAPANSSSVTQISPDQAHANIMSSFPTQHIITSDDIHSYLLQHYGTSKHTVYIQDARKFIDMSSVTMNSPASSLDKRQGSGTNPCFGYTNYWAEQPQSWWNNWSPASSCFWTGKDKKGGTQSLNWSFSISISENAGVSWDVVKSVLSATVGFTVTETWSQSSTYACNVPGNSVGQIWIQNKIGWGWIWAEGCQSCEYGGGCGGRFGFAATAKGGAEAPEASTQNGQGIQLGCSTGQKNVQC